MILQFIFMENNFCVKKGKTEIFVYLIYVYIYKQDGWAIPDPY